MQGCAFSARRPLGVSEGDEEGPAWRGATGVPGARPKNTGDGARPLIPAGPAVNAWISLGFSAQPGENGFL